MQKWVQAGSKHQVDGGAPFSHSGLAGLLHRLIGLEGGQVEEVVEHALTLARLFVFVGFEAVLEVEGVLCGEYVDHLLSP